MFFTNYLWLTIAQKEIQLVIRNKVFYILVAILWVLLLVAALGGYKNYRAVRDNRASAASLFRHEWEEQQANPHAAAHFGTYLFKPFTFMGLFDTGLSRYTGVSYRVEAHKQHEVNDANVMDSDAYMRFGELTLAAVFQLLVPLLIIFLGFSAIAGEREGNTLKMLLAQGVKPVQLTGGKVLGCYLLVLAITLPAWGGMLISTSFNPSRDFMWTRLLAFIGSYLVYFFVITALVMIISVFSRNAKVALLSCLGVWICFCVLLPRMAAGLADAAYPLPSRYAFNKEVERGFAAGINGDKDSRARSADYLKQVLARYKVDSVTRLPVNFDGLAMQYGEDYNTKVYQQYHAQVVARIKKQQRLQELFCFMDPFLAVQQLSMGFSGTDFSHHLHFHQQALAYRNNFIRHLNMALANSGSKYGSYQYQVGPAFFKQMKDFTYQLPAAGWALRQHLTALIALFCWLGAVLCMLHFVSKRIAVA